MFNIYLVARTFNCLSKYFYDLRSLQSLVPQLYAYIKTFMESIFATFCQPFDLSRALTKKHLRGISFIRPLLLAQIFFFMAFCSFSVKFKRFLLLLMNKQRVNTKSSRFQVFRTRQHPCGLLLRQLGKDKSPISNFDASNFSPNEMLRHKALKLREFVMNLTSSRTRALTAGQYANQWLGCNSSAVF